MEFEELRQGDYVKARVGNERLWFQVLSHVGVPSNAVICRLASAPETGIVFDGRCTIDRDWIIETSRARSALKLVTT